MATMKNLATIAIVMAFLAGCQSVDADRLAAAGTDPFLDLPELSCAPHGRPNGTPAELTAQRMSPGHTGYIEFRQRLLPGLPSGHLYVVFGRLDEVGDVATRQYVGLHPVGDILGLYGGAMVPMPATLKPTRADCTYRVYNAYRVSLTEAQYRRLVVRVRAELADPPKWHLAAFNCNHFAASLGEVVGLRAPENRLLPAFAYIHALIEANEGWRGHGA